MPNILTTCTTTGADVSINPSVATSLNGQNAGLVLRLQPTRWLGPGIRTSQSRFEWDCTLCGNRHYWSPDLSKDEDWTTVMYLADIPQVWRNIEPRILNNLPPADMRL